jgi:hypothetical protein
MHHASLNPVLSVENIEEMLNPPTHQDLVKMASRWLTQSERCGVVIAEIVSSAGEIPDVIGWRLGHSIVVECKVSRSDFLRDRLKSHHRNGLAMGVMRYYLTVEGIIKPEELEGHGLLEVRASKIGQYLDRPRIHCVQKAERRDLLPEAYVKELRVMSSALRRIKTREFITILEGAE